MARRSSAPTDVEALAPFVEWPDLVALMGYRHDEHVTIIGPTGRGKTTIALELLKLRRNVVVIATKPKDETLDGLVRSREYVKALAIPNVAVARRVVVWPRIAKVTDLAAQTRAQSEIVGRALDQIFSEGNRAVLVDEVHYAAEFLRMAPRLKLIWQQGRSNGVSLIAGFQRPAWVPRDAYSSATHLFVFGTNDQEDIRSLGGLGGMNSNDIRSVVAWLAGDERRRHEFLYVNTRTGNMVRSRLRKSKGSR